MARKRTLRPEESDLWAAVARSARPMHPQRPAPPAADTPPIVVPVKPVKPAPAPLPPFRLGEKTAPGRSGVSHVLAPLLSDTPVRMDARTHARMTRGKLAPEARIDLHGMTLAEAHPELIRFLLNAHAGGLRLVLVITGKGRQMWEPVPRPMGALRHQVPHWLRLPPLGHVVLQVAEAHLKHGGSGAYYVYLRRG